MLNACSPSGSQEPWCLCWVEGACVTSAQYKPWALSLPGASPGDAISHTCLFLSGELRVACVMRGRLLEASAWTPSDSAPCVSSLC